MSKDVKIPEELQIKALNELRSIVPTGSWVLFTPYEGMIVSPDPKEIKRMIDIVMQSASK